MKKNIKEKKKVKFSEKKDCVIKSLFDVNCFLSNIGITMKSIKIYKWFK